MRIYSERTMPTTSLYTKAKEKLLRGQIDLVGATIKVILFKNTYPQDLVNDEFLSQVEIYRLGTDQTLSSKTVAGGAFAAADITFPTVPAGDTSEGVGLYVDTGNPATSSLLLYTDDIQGFPVATSGANIGVAWDKGQYKIFAI